MTEKSFVQLFADPSINLTYDVRKIGRDSDRLAHIVENVKFEGPLVRVLASTKFGVRDTVA